MVSRRFWRSRSPSSAPIFAVKAIRPNPYRSRITRITRSARWRRTTSKSWPGSALRVSPRRVTIVARACCIACAAIIHIIPTHHLLTRVSRSWGLFSWHWFFMAQPFDLPERMMLADPEFYLRKKLGKGPEGMGFFAPEAFAEYLRCFKDPATARGMCEDYRATFGVDLAMDEADAAAGRQIECPVLLLWGATGGVGRNHQPLEIWRGYARDIRGAAALPCGHYVPEQCPVETAAALRAFFTRPLDHK